MRRYIRWYGRKDLGTGILLNRTDGGEGGSGVIQSAYTREKRRISNIGKNKGRVLKPLTDEHKLKISTSLKGQKREFSAEHRAKLSEANRLRPPPSDATRAKLREAARNRHLT